MKKDTSLKTFLEIPSDMLPIAFNIPDKSEGISKEVLSDASFFIVKQSHGKSN